MPRVATIVKNATTTIRKYGAKIANSKTLTIARCRLRNSGEKTATTSCIMCTAFAETVIKPSCMAVAT